jgi:hypothetical protein
MVIAAIALLVAWRTTRPVEHPLTRLNVDANGSGFLPVGSSRKSPSKAAHR